jgi:hypothetical protein
MVDRYIVVSGDHWDCLICPPPNNAGGARQGGRHAKGARHRKRVKELEPQPPQSRIVPLPPLTIPAQPPLSQAQPSIPLPPVPAPALPPPASPVPVSTVSAGAVGPSPASADAAAALQALQRLQRPQTPHRIAPPSFDSPPPVLPAASANPPPQPIATGVGSLGLQTFAVAAASSVSVPASAASAAGAGAGAGAASTPVSAAALVPAANGFQTPPAPPSSISPLVLAPPVIPTLYVCSAAALTQHSIAPAHRSSVPVPTVQRCTGENDEKCACTITRSEDAQFYIVEFGGGMKTKRCYECQHSVGRHPHGTSFALSLSGGAVIHCVVCHGVRYYAVCRGRAVPYCSTSAGSMSTRCSVCVFTVARCTILCFVGATESRTG